MRTNQTKIPSSAYQLCDDKELTGCLVDAAWISFITKSLTTSDLLGRPDVVHDLTRMEESGGLPELRRMRQPDIDRLMDGLLAAPPKQRPQLLQKAGPVLRALLLDRVQVATFRLVETARPDRSIPVETVQPLLELFSKALHGALDRGSFLV